MSGNTDPYYLSGPQYLGSVGIDADDLGGRADMVQFSVDDPAHQRPDVREALSHYIRKEIVALMAGPAAGKCHNSKSNVMRAFGYIDEHHAIINSDITRVIPKIEYVHGEYTDELFMLYYRRAFKFVGKHWGKISALADVLLERRKLDPWEARKAIYLASRKTVTPTASVQSEKGLHMATPNERAERERLRKRAARQGFKLYSGTGEVQPYGLQPVNGRGEDISGAMFFHDLAEVAEELRVRAAEQTTARALIASMQKARSGRSLQTKGTDTMNTTPKLEAALIALRDADAAADAACDAAVAHTMNAPRGGRWGKALGGRDVDRAHTQAIDDKRKAVEALCKILNPSLHKPRRTGGR
jgi:hypothetical protein